MCSSVDKQCAKIDASSKYSCTTSTYTTVIVIKLAVFSYKKSFIVTSNSPVKYIHDMQLMLLAAQYVSRVELG